MQMIDATKIFFSIFYGIRVLSDFNTFALVVKNFVNLRVNFLKKANHIKNSAFDIRKNS